LLVTVVFLSAQSEKADFFIAKDLSEFEIFNRYQQKLSASAKIRFVEYTPWKILDKNMLLGDQITHAMHVEHKGTTFYFILNTEGVFKNEPQTFHGIFEDCILINDQVSVEIEKGVLFREIPFSKKGDAPRIYLDKDIQLKRLFKKGPSYFVKNNNRGVYGWIRYSNTAAVKLVTKEKLVEKALFSELLVNQVERKVNQVNTVYERLFDHLNNEYGQIRRAPHWVIVHNEQSIILNLQNVTQERLRRSTSYFINDIENIFSGEPVFISSEQNSITISLNDEN